MAVLALDAAADVSDDAKDEWTELHELELLDELDDSKLLLLLELRLELLDELSDEEEPEDELE